MIQGVLLISGCPDDTGCPADFSVSNILIGESAYFNS